MTDFTYIITEGVLDVCFLTQVLRTGMNLKQIRSIDGLPAAAKEWIGRFRWPIGSDIARLAVPAPVFIGDDSGKMLIGLRNASGLSGIRKQMDADHEAFGRIGWRPSAAGVILDLDTESPQSRFEAFASLLHGFGYPQPVQLDKVHSVGSDRAGVFGLPGDGKAGTLEDLLLPLGQARFPQLAAHAAGFIAGWKQVPGATDAPHEDLRKPAGFKKAEVAAMSALLKPGRSLIATLEDHGWVPSPPSASPLLGPLAEFLKDLLSPAPKVSQSP